MMVNIILVFLLLLCSSPAARADTIDDKIENAMNTLNIRGASVAFYDKVSGCY